MTEEVEMKVENQLITEKRDLNIYHHATRSAHIISPGSSTTIGLRGVEEDDYLHISVVSGPGNLWKHCLIDLPSWADFEFSSEGKVAFTHKGERTLIDIPPGPPKWELKMTRPNGTPIPPSPGHITIGENAPG